MLWGVVCLLTCVSLLTCTSLLTYTLRYMQTHTHTRERKRERERERESEPAWSPRGGSAVVPSARQRRAWTTQSISSRFETPCSQSSKHTHTRTHTHGMSGSHTFQHAGNTQEAERRQRRGACVRTLSKAARNLMGCWVYGSVLGVTRPSTAKASFTSKDA